MYWRQEIFLFPSVTELKEIKLSAVTIDIIDVHLQRRNFGIFQNWTFTIVQLFMVHQESFTFFLLFGYHEKQEYKHKIPTNVHCLRMRYFYPFWVYVMLNICSYIKHNSMSASFVKIWHFMRTNNTNFHYNLSSQSAVGICGQAHGWTDRQTHDFLHVVQFTHTQ